LTRCRELRDQSGFPASILFHAVCRNLEIIGEASRKIGPDFRGEHPNVPWREMNALRTLMSPKREDRYRNAGEARVALEGAR
jgi:uncharacterized protein with HEPN domain